MKNADTWLPSKYVYRNGKLMASRNPDEVSIGSRLVADLVAQRYADNLERHANGKLLDLGCGQVPLYLAYKGLVSETICVDWANTRHANNHLDHECDLTEPLPFADDEFDTIILSDVLEHIPSPEHLWAEMRRILRPGGKLIMNVPFFYCLHEKPHDYYRYTEFALRRYADQAGLDVVQLEPVGGSPEIFADMMAKHLQFVVLVGSPLARLVQFLTRQFVGTAVGRRLSTRTAEAFPLGYFLVARKA